MTRQSVRFVLVGANRVWGLLSGLLVIYIVTHEFSGVEQGYFYAFQSLVTVLAGDATQMDLPPESFDVVMQSTVFSSLLDDDFQMTLARCMWQWVRPGGGVLWYDFTYNNPANPDVRGVPLSRVRELFPEGHIRSQRITLAPPLARAVCRVHPRLYPVFNALPLLRTHVQAWIAKA